MNFDDLLRFNHENDRYRFHLKQRCLQPGHYAQYLRQWLQYFPAKQVIEIHCRIFE